MLIGLMRAMYAMRLGWLCYKAYSSVSEIKTEFSSCFFDVGVFSILQPSFSRPSHRCCCDRNERWPESLALSADLQQRFIETDLSSFNEEV